MTPKEKPKAKLLLLLVKKYFNLKCMVHKTHFPSSIIILDESELREYFAQLSRTLL